MSLANPIHWLAYSYVCINAVSRSAAEGISDVLPFLLSATIASQVGVLVHSEQGSSKANREMALK